VLNAHFVRNSTITQGAVDGISSSASSGNSALPAGFDWSAGGMEADAFDGQESLVCCFFVFSTCLVALHKSLKSNENPTLSGNRTVLRILHALLRL
jgi:hypothetical protein